MPSNRIPPEAQRCILTSYIKCLSIGIYAITNITVLSILSISIIGYNYEKVKGISIPQIRFCLILQIIFTQEIN